MEEAAAIKVLAAYGKSREEIIEFLKQMEQERTEREKTDNPVIPSEHS
jgi:TusA-related sulfurtransferase